MRVSFRPFDPQDKDDVAALVRWSNDQTIRHLSNRFCDADAEARRCTSATVLQRYEDEMDSHTTHMVIVDGMRAGEVSLTIDPPILHRKLPGSDWIGMVIGEGVFRGRGVGRRSLAYLEALSRAAGCVRVELGVFEFNSVALSLYRSAGYTTLCEIPDVTFWSGRFWSDVRLEKPLLV